LNKEKRRRENVTITGIREIRGDIENWGGRMVRKGAFKINKDKLMLAKIESWEQKKDIMLNKSKLKERKGDRI
jgi:hypothetical protein